METTRKTVEGFYAAAQRRDMSAAREFLDPNLTFYGLFETYRNADEYLTALAGLLSITTSLEVKTIVAEGENVALFFDLTTTAPAAAKTLVAEWHVVRNGKITQVRSAFDGRPFAAMFGAVETRQGASLPEADSMQAEQAIRALKDAFAQALLNRDAKFRASLWTEDGTVVPPQGGFFKGRRAMESHFATEGATITQTSKASFDTYRFRFLTPDLALVDTVLTLNNVQGPDGHVQAVTHVAIVFTAVRQDDRWLVQDERAHFADLAAS